MTTRNTHDTWGHHSTSTGYPCPELSRPVGVPATRFAAYALPSRMGNRLHYPDGRVKDTDHAVQPPRTEGKAP